MDRFVYDDPGQLQWLYKPPAMLAAERARDARRYRAALDDRSRQRDDPDVKQKGNAADS